VGGEVGFRCLTYLFFLPFFPYYCCIFIASKQKNSE
jgi:hypothetical protein